MTGIERNASYRLLFGQLGTSQFHLGFGLFNFQFQGFDITTQTLDPGRDIALGSILVTNPELFQPLLCFFELALIGLYLGINKLERALAFRTLLARRAFKETVQYCAQYLERLVRLPAAVGQLQKTPVGYPEIHLLAQRCNGGITLLVWLHAGDQAGVCRHLFQESPALDQLPGLVDTVQLRYFSLTPQKRLQHTALVGIEHGMGGIGFRCHKGHGQNAGRHQHEDHRRHNPLAVQLQLYRT